MIQQRCLEHGARRCTKDSKLSADKKIKKIYQRCIREEHVCESIRQEILETGIAGKVEQAKADRITDETHVHVCAANGHCSQQSMTLTINFSESGSLVCSTFDQICEEPFQQEPLPVPLRDWDTPVASESPRVRTLIGRGGHFQANGKVGGAIHPRQRTVAILREPISRTISEYRHVCLSGEGQWDYSTRSFRKSVYTRQKNTLDLGDNTRASRLGGIINCSEPAVMKQFLMQPENANGMQNRGVRMLAGATLSTTYSDVERRTDARLFADAVKELHALDSIILTEEYGLSVVVMASKFLVAPPSSYNIIRERKEGSKFKPGMASVPKTPEIMDIVKQHNALDSKLYELAKERLKIEGRTLFGSDEKMKMCTSYTCVPLETPRQLSREIVSAGAEEEQPVADEGVDDDDGGDDDDDGEFVRAENIYDRPAAGKGDRSTHQFYLLGYVITETCTADFDVDACYGPPDSRWWDE